MEEIGLLDKGIAYVSFEFSDGSRRIIRTTRNKDILNEYSVVFIKNHLYDLDSKEYYKIREDAIKVDITETLPASRNEVESFVRRFIH